MAINRKQSSKELTELRPVYIRDSTFDPATYDISVVDLILVLVQRKFLIGLIAILCFIIGAVVAFLSVKQYTFTTTLEIGSQISNGVVQSLEPPATVIAKLRHSFIPLTMAEYQQQNPENKVEYEILVSSPEKSSIITLDVHGSEFESKLLVKLLEAILHRLVLDHSSIFQSIKIDLETSLEEAKVKLAELNKNDANLSTKSIIQSNIKAYKAQLANLRNTHQILPPMRSMHPTSRRKNTTVVIAAGIGLILGILAAFLTEIIVKVKEKQKEKSN